MNKQNKLLLMKLIESNPFIRLRELSAILKAPISTIHDSLTQIKQDYNLVGKFVPKGSIKAPRTDLRPCKHCGLPCYGYYCLKCYRKRRGLGLCKN